MNSTTIKDQVYHQVSIQVCDQAWLGINLKKIYHDFY